MLKVSAELYSLLTIFVAPSRKSTTTAGLPFGTPTSILSCTTDYTLHTHLHHFHDILSSQVLHGLTHELTNGVGHTQDAFILVHVEHLLHLSGSLRAEAGQLHQALGEQRSDVFSRVVTKPSFSCSIGGVIPDAKTLRQ